MGSQSNQIGIGEVQSPLAVVVPKRPVNKCPCEEGAFGFNCGQASSAQRQQLTGGGVFALALVMLQCLFGAELG